MKESICSICFENLGDLPVLKIGSNLIGVMLLVVRKFLTVLPGSVCCTNINLLHMSLLCCAGLP